jgi:heme oxygenase
MARLLKGPKGFTLGEYCHDNHDSWPGYAGTFTWRQSWVKFVGSDTAHVHPIDHRGDWNGLFKIMSADEVRVMSAEVQHDLGFTHCHTCGFEIFDCECPEQIDLEDLI